MVTNLLFRLYLIIVFSLEWNKSGMGKIGENEGK
jgi:hypothetical protein